MGVEKVRTGVYKKIEIDNAVCNRRFHLSFEEGSTPEKHVEIDCPHCGIKLFEADNHPQVVLAREENLVKSPDGSRTTLHDCRFLR